MALTNFTQMVDFLGSLAEHNEPSATPDHLSKNTLTHYDTTDGCYSTVDCTIDVSVCSAWSHYVRVRMRKYICFLYIFGRAGVRWPLFCECRPLMIFKGCLDSNPVKHSDKQARHQLGHPSLYNRCMDEWLERWENIFIGISVL